MASDGDHHSWPDDELRRRLQSMDDFEFEHLIADLWRHQGWSAEVEQQSSDAGVDIRATKTAPYRKKSLIQAKRYSDTNTVGGPDIQQYSALKQQEPDADEAIIVTTGYFTGSAEDRARDLNVKLIDGDDLTDLIDELDAYDIAEEYLDTTPESSEDVANSSVRRGLQHLSGDEREAIESATGQSTEEFLKDEQYRANRAMERAHRKVVLNPHDAAEFGIFPDTDADVEREFESQKAKLAILKDDLHLDSDGELFVENLKEYIPKAAIAGKPTGRVVGVIRRGVSDKQWLADGGAGVLKAHEFADSVREEAKRFLDLEGADTGGVNTENQWRLYTAVAGVITWGVLWFWISLIPDTAPAVAGGIMLIAWITLPIGMFLDARKTGISDVLPKTTAILVICSLIPMLAVIPGLVYLYKRERTDWPTASGPAVDDDNAGHPSTAE